MNKISISGENKHMTNFRPPAFTSTRQGLAVPHLRRSLISSTAKDGVASADAGANFIIVCLGVTVAVEFGLETGRWISMR